MAKQKATHPWKKPLSPRKAAQDREDLKKLMAGNPIYSLTGNYPTYKQAYKPS